MTALVRYKSAHRARHLPIGHDGVRLDSDTRNERGRLVGGLFMSARKSLLV